MGASSPLASLSIIGKWTVFSSQWFLRFWLKVLLLALIIICSSCLGPCEVITTGQGRSLSHPAPWETLIWFNPICSWHLNNTGLNYVNPLTWEFCSINTYYSTTDPPLVESADAEGQLQNYTQLFNCLVVGPPNFHIVQGSTVLFWFFFGNIDLFIIFGCTGSSLLCTWPFSSCSEQRINCFYREHFLI